MLCTPSTLCARALNAVLPVVTFLTASRRCNNQGGWITRLNPDVYVWMTLNNQWQCAELVCTQSHANANSAHTPTRMAAAAATKVPQLLVASKSPAKITACREAVQKVLPHIQNVHGEVLQEEACSCSCGGENFRSQIRSLNAVLLLMLLCTCFCYKAFDIPSLVRPQPFDDDETLQG